MYNLIHFKIIIHINEDMSNIFDATPYSVVTVSRQQHILSCHRSNGGEARWRTFKTVTGFAYRRTPMDEKEL